MKTLLPLLSAALLTACAYTPPPVEPIGVPINQPGPVQPIAVPIGQPGQPVRFPDAVNQYFRYSSGMDEAANLVINRQTEWAALWAQLTRRHGEPPPPPYVDFGREMLLVSAMGAQATGGYAIAIDQVFETPSTIDAYVVRTSPGPRCGVTAALTQPVDIVRVPVSQKPVRWYIRDQVSDCP